MVTEEQSLCYAIWHEQVMDNANKRSYNTHQLEILDTGIGSYCHIDDIIKPVDSDHIKALHGIANLYDMDARNLALFVRAEYIRRRYSNIFYAAISLARIPPKTFHVQSLVYNINHLSEIWSHEV